MQCRHSAVDEPDHSTYSNKEIFLCELMPNFFDIRDEIQYEFIIHPDKVEAQPDFSSKIIPVESNSTIKIEDSGLRMTTCELLNNRRKSLNLAPRFCM